MPISVNPIFPVISAQGAAPDLVLQPGTVIDAQVLKILTNDLVRIAIANLSIEVLSEIPLQAGQTLQLAVSQTPNGIKLAVVGQGSATPASPASPVVARPGAAPANVISDSVTLAPDAPVTDAPGSIAASLVAVAPRNVLTPLEALAVSAAAQSAAPRQQSLAPLFANLGAALGLDTLPPKLQQAVVQLLTLRPSLDQNLTGDDVKAAFQKSGLFLEASLGQESAAVGQEAVVSTSGFPDLKAALIVLRQTLSSLSPTLSQSVSLPASTAPASAAPATSKQPQQPQQPSYAPQAPYTAAGTIAASAAEAASATEATSEPPPVPPFISAAPLAPEIDVQEIFLPQARLPVADDFTEWNGPAGLFAAQEAPPAASPRATPIIEVLNLVQEAQQSVSKDAANVAKSGFAESILSDPLEVLLDRASAAGLQKVFRSDSADIAATAHTNG